MATILNGDPYNLQGGANPQQTGNPQGSVYNPQQAANPFIGPVLPQPVKTVSTPAPLPPAQPKASAAPVAQPIKLNSIFDPYIGTRASASNPGVLEYYNKATGAGFANPQQLYQFASQLGAGQISDFSQLQAPVQSAQGINATPAIPDSGSFSIANPVNPAQQLAAGAGIANISPTDLQNLANASSVLSPQQVQQIWQQLGITPESINSIFAPPAQNTVDFYNNAYNAAGLADIKNQFESLNNDIAQARSDYTNAVATENENPFLSQATLVGRLNNIQNQSEQKINDLVSQQQQLQTLYQQGLQEVSALTANHSADFQNTQQLNAAKLSYLTQQAEALATAQQQSNAAQVYRYLPDYLAGKVQGQQQQTVTSPTTGAVFRWNPVTGQFDTVSEGTGNYVLDPTTGQLYDTRTGLPASSTTGGGFGSAPPQSSNIPQRNNNPGAIRSASGQFASYATPQAGWNALVQDLTGKMTGNTSTGLNGNSTLQQLINTWAPASDGNNPTSYAQAVAAQLGVSVATPISTLLPRVQDLAVAIAQHEGYFAGSTQQTQNATSSLIQQYTSYTQNNLPYINLDKVPKDLSDVINTQGRAQGIPVLNQDEVSKLQAIDVSNENLTKIEGIVSTFLPTSPADRLFQGPLNTLQSALQTNSNISSFNSWRTAIINNVQALAGGSGSGLRINQAEINTAMQNDLPTITDTIETANNKIANLKSQLASWQQELTGVSTPGSSGNTNDPLGLGL